MKLEKWIRSRIYRLQPSEVSVSGGKTQRCIRISRELESFFDKPEVEFYCDEENKIIGIKPVEKGKGFKVGRENKKYPYMHLCAQLFLTDLNVANCRYKTTVQDGMLIFRYETK